MLLRLSHRRYRLPFRAPVRTAHGVWSEREGLYVRLEDAQGRVGYGEVAALSWFGTETVEEAEAALSKLGGDGDEGLLAALPSGLTCLKSALRAALEDLREEPGNADAGAAGPEAVQVAALLPAGRAGISAARDKVDAGFRVFKWKVGVADASDEMAMLDDLISSLPEGSRLRLDANGAWDRRRAERWLACCADRPVEYVEQPVAPDARGADDLLLGLAGDFPTPLALDESLVRDGDVERWLSFGWPGVFVLKPSLLADPDGVCATLLRAKARVVFSSALETALGAKRALRTAFAWEGERLALGMGVWPLFQDGRFDGPPCLPFIRKTQVQDIDAQRLWNALT